MTRPIGPGPYSADEIAYRLRSELWYAEDLHASVKPPIKNLSKDEATFIMTFSDGHRVRVTINQLPPDKPVPAGEERRGQGVRADLRHGNEQAIG